MSRIVDIEPLLERLRNIPASNPNDDPDLMDVGEAIYTAIVELEALPIIGPKALRPVYCASLFTGFAFMKRLIKPALKQKTFRKVKFHRSLSSVCSVSSDVIMASHYISINILSVCTTCCIR
jgi:hypothetical protein